MEYDKFSEQIKSLGKRISVLKKDIHTEEGTIHDNYVVKFFPYLHVYEIGETFDYDDL